MSLYIGVLYEDASFMPAFIPAPDTTVEQAIDIARWHVQLPTTLQIWNEPLRVATESAVYDGDGTRIWWSREGGDG